MCIQKYRCCHHHSNVQTQQHTCAVLTAPVQVYLRSQSINQVHHVFTFVFSAPSVTVMSPLFIYSGSRPKL